MLDWFKFNSLKANPDKFQFMVLEANKNKSFSINVRGISIPSKNEVIFPVGNYMFKVNNRNTRTRYEIGSKLTTKMAERCQWHFVNELLLSCARLGE